MFIRVTNFHNGKIQRFNINNIVSYAEGTQGGKPATYIETVNQRGSDEPYFIRESPTEVDSLIEISIYKEESA